MGNYQAIRSFVYIAGNVILPAQNNTNENTIYNQHNLAFTGTTGVGHGHTGAAFDGPLLNHLSLDLSDDYVWTGSGNKFSNGLEIDGTVTGGATYNGITLSSPILAGTIPPQVLPAVLSNFSIVRSSANTIKITSRSGAALSSSNYMVVNILNPASPGTYSTFTVTADVSIVLDGATWNLDTRGNLTGYILSVMAINDNGTLKWAVGPLGMRTTLFAADTTATAASVNKAEMVLCNSAVGSSTNYCAEVGYFRADFTDSGNTWAIQTGPNDVISGRTADGVERPFPFVVTGGTGDGGPATIWWMTNGTKLTFYCSMSSDISSNSTSFTVKAACKSRDGVRSVPGEARDNTANLANPGLAVMLADDDTITLNSTFGGATWTNSGGKAMRFTLITDIGPAASFIQ